jgi:hypothetical protein
MQKSKTKLPTKVAARRSKPVTKLRPPQAKTPISSDGANGRKRGQLRIAQKSMAKARSVFKNFSLSKFAGSDTPSHYVAAGENPAKTQKRIITQHIANLKSSGASSRAMTLSFPETRVKELLPSFKAKAGTIDVQDVVNLLEHNRAGNEFYAKGNPTLNRLAIQSQVQQIISTIKGGAK